MWKNYSWGYLKNNRASGISVLVAAFISALFLSLLSSLFFNFWKYDVENTIAQEGDWQGRLSGVLDAEAITRIERYKNVQKAILNEELSDKRYLKERLSGEPLPAESISKKEPLSGAEVVVDIYFTNMRRILTDMPKIAKLVGLPPEAISYHHSYLNQYLIRDPNDPHPRLLFPFYLGVAVLACFSLILIIHNSFAVSMQARMHQFGIFSSIGATPKQIRLCLLQEAAALCTVPVLAGNLAGIAGSAGLVHLANYMLKNVQGRALGTWGYHPLLFVPTFAATVLTIWISAWLPAAKMGRLTPLEAIKSTGELQLKRKKHSRIAAFFFGIEGELAANALWAQRKALRTASLSLVFSFLAFTLMQCFFTLSQISTRMTYFEAYQDAWDIMVTVKATPMEAFAVTDEIRGLAGVRNGVVYQKASAKRIITKDEISEEMLAFGGFSHASEKDVTKSGDGWLVNAPLVILDDASFLDYCRQVGTNPRLDGAVIFNQIRDVTNPNFRNPQFHPYLKTGSDTSVLRHAAQEELQAEVPVICYTDEVPVLREEYASLDYYELVHFLPVSLWKEIKGQIGDAKEDTYVRVLAKKGVQLEELKELESNISQCIVPLYDAETENRIQKKISNDEMILGMMLILGGFCVLLAMIGLGNVFSNTLGFVRQRRREFARYMSVGLAPKGVRKMFCIEALIIASRPVLVTLPLAVAAVGLMLKASYLEPMVFIRELPAVPILLFILHIFGFVALAYFIGWRKIAGVSLAEVLRDDTMM